VLSSKSSKRERIEDEGWMDAEEAAAVGFAAMDAGY
jgi:hypothetical protein